MTVTVDQNDAIKRRIIELQTEHRALDVEIEEVQHRIAVDPAGTDEIGLRRLKKRKLMIKDAMTQLQMRLVPDIPA